MEMNKGFTLVELLVAVALVGVISVVASNSFFTLLRSTAKSDNLKDIKQNGDYALSVLETKIRNAANIYEVTTPCDGTARASLVLVNQDATRTTIACATGRIQETTGAITNSLTSSNVVVPQSCALSQFSIACSLNPTTLTKNVQINFNLTLSSAAVSASEQVQQSFGTQIQLRNK